MQRTGVSPRRLLAAALAVTVMGMVSVPRSGPMTQAASPRPASSSPFIPVALPGFGDPANSWPWAMEYYKNRVYVGTNRNFFCVENASVHIVAPIVPYPVAPSCPTPISALPPTLGAQIWSVDPSLSASRPLTQSDWQQTYTDTTTLPMTVSGTLTPTIGPRNMGFRGMSVFDDGNPNGPALYVSGVGLKPLAGTAVAPPALLRSTDGAHFQPVPSDPGTTMGDINTLSTIPNSPGTIGGCCIRGQAQLRDAAGTRYFFITIGSIIGAGAVFVSQQPQLGDNAFVQLTPPDMQVFEIEAFNGHLYLGVQSLTGGYEVVRTDCFTPPSGQTSCPDSAFTTVVPAGGGLGSQGNPNIVSMQVFTTTDSSGFQTPHLYVGTDGYDKKQPAEVVRINQDDSWDLIMGQARTFPVSLNNGQCSGVLSNNNTLCTLSPLSGLNAGFDWPFNWHMWRMEDYQGVLFVGTLDVSTRLFAGTPQASQLQSVMGFDLWASADGIHFWPVTQNGFGNLYNVGARSLISTPYGLFVGSVNTLVGATIFEGASTTAALALAPRSVHAEVVKAAGTVAVSWNPAPGARTYHVYRSTAALAALPQPKAPLVDPETGRIVYGPFPASAWVPGAYTEIGETQGTTFVDANTRRGGHYSYYAIGDDGAGSLSTPSPVATVPSPLPAATVHGVLSWLGTTRVQGAIPVARVSLAVRSAYQQLLAHDARGSQERLETLRHDLLAMPTDAQGRLYVDELADRIDQIGLRVALVADHHLAPWRLG